MRSIVAECSGVVIAAVIELTRILIVHPGELLVEFTVVSFRLVQKTAQSAQSTHKQTRFVAVDCRRWSIFFAIYLCENFALGIKVNSNQLSVADAMDYLYLLVAPASNTVYMRNKTKEGPGQVGFKWPACA